MSTRVAVSEPVLSWALRRSERTFEEALTRFPKLGDWMGENAQPTLHDLEKFAGVFNCLCIRLLFERIDA